MFGEAWTKELAQFFLSCQLNVACVTYEHRRTLHIKRMPRMKSKSKTNIVHTRLSETLYDKIKKKADAHNISVSQLVRIVLQKASEPSTKVNIEVCFDSARS